MKNPLTSWVKRYRYGLTTICTALLICLTAQAPQAQLAPAPEQSRPADAFVDSIGVATHLRYLDTAYGHYEDIIKPRLQELGIRHIRDGGKDPELFRRLNDLSTTLGVKATLVMDPRDGIMPSNVVNDVLKPVLGAIEAAEGPNEWDVQPQLTYAGQPFPQGIRRYQSELFSAIETDPATADIPVLMPSLAFPSNSNRLGYLDALHMGNMHSYAGGNLPSQDLDSKWIPDTQVVTGVGKPIVATECGWHTAVGDTHSSQPGISEQAAGKYIPRLFLEYFKRGVRRAYLYELIDQRIAGDQENNFGLLHTDGTPKPSFTALKNLVQLLKDPGTGAGPNQTLSYSLSGDLANVDHLLLQKRDGRFYLVLWQEVPSFDVYSKVDLPVAGRSVTLSFNSAISRAAAYYPAIASTASQTYSAPTQLQLNVPDHPLVLELVASSGPASTPIAPAATAQPTQAPQASPAPQPATVAPATAAPAPAPSQVNHPTDWGMPL